MPIVYWAISKKHARRLMALALGSALVSEYLKLAFHRPRPYQVAPERVTAMFSETGYGFPSGHTLFATVMAGYAWCRAPHRWVRVVVAVLVIMMGLSRMIHGLHFPQDVVAGLLVGLALIAIYQWLDTNVFESLGEWSVTKSMIVTVLLAAVAFVGALLIEHDYEERKRIISIIGAMAGGLTGFTVEHHFVRFSAGGSVSRRILRTLVGLVLTVGVFFGLDVLYDVLAGDSTGTGALVVYAIRYGLVALVAAAGAPYLFIRMRLADPE